VAIDVPHYEITDSELLLAFSTPVFQCSLPFDMAPIADAILKRAWKDEGVQHSNQGGWQSGGAGHDYESKAEVPPQFLDYDDIPEMQEILNFIGAFLVPESKGQHFTKRWNVGAWANVNRPGGDKNEWHTHPGAFWSCVFWVKLPSDMTGGELMLHDPRGHLAIHAHPYMSIAHEACRSAGAAEAIVPQVGKLACFPGWLPHDARPFTGSSERVSVALNFSPIMEEK